MSISTVFINNSQAVRLPLDARAKGNERIFAPVGRAWESFFLEGYAVSDDSMAERASQHQSERESLGCYAICWILTSSSMY